MKILRVYVDTSVIGGCFDAEFAIWSRGLIEDFRVGILRPVLSEVVAVEVHEAPEQVRVIYGELLALGAEVLTVSDEARSLTSTYQVRSVLPGRFANDMLHIALATIGEVDVLVSWNFKHIVHLDKIRLFNAVNIELGYKPLTIYSPREVTIHGNERDQSS